MYSGGEQHVRDEPGGRQDEGREEEERETGETGEGAGE